MLRGQRGGCEANVKAAPDPEKPTPLKFAFGSVMYYRTKGGNLLRSKEYKELEEKLYGPVADGGSPRLPRHSLARKKLCPRFTRTGTPLIHHPHGTGSHETSPTQRRPGNTHTHTPYPSPFSPRPYRILFRTGKRTTNPYSQVSARPAPAPTPTTPPNSQPANPTCTSASAPTGPPAPYPMT